MQLIVLCGRPSATVYVFSGRCAALTGVAREKSSAVQIATSSRRRAEVTRTRRERLRAFTAPLTRDAAGARELHRRGRKVWPRSPDVNSRIEGSRTETAGSSLGGSSHLPELKLRITGKLRRRHRMSAANERREEWISCPGQWKGPRGVTRHLVHRIRTPLRPDRSLAANPQWPSHSRSGHRRILSRSLFHRAPLSLLPELGAVGRGGTRCQAHRRSHRFNAACKNGVAGQSSQRRWRTGLSDPCRTLVSWMRLEPIDNPFGQLDCPS